MLRRAGVAFDFITADFDEAAFKATAHADGLSVNDLALTLATMKARRVSTSRREALVIGADQVLHCDNIRFSKPSSRSQAKTHLQQLRGKTHHLATAVVCMQGDAILWHHVESPSLTMRSVSDSFLETYLDEEGDDILTSVGAYLLESRGVQLFERIDGSYFTILGLPLLALLGFLRQAGILPS
ncbi:Maf family protein [Acidiphilium sp.]|uniref:Maf family protein n=1 Tax=Acidiphilium sp. TaxID=527 RepID=UPI003D0064CB